MNDVKFSRELEVASFLAIKNTFHRKKMLLLIGVIVGLGLLSMIFSSSVILGLENVIEDKAIGAITGNILIDHEVDEDYIPNGNEVVKKVLNLPGVEAVSPHVNRGITLIDEYGNKVSVQLRIVDPVKEAETTLIDDSIISGSYLSKYDDGILLGSDLTKKYRNIKSLPAIDVDAGEMVTAVFDNGRSVKIKVKGIYSLGFAGTDYYAFISQEAAKKYLNLTEDSFDRPSEILVKSNLPKGSERELVKRMLLAGVNGRILPWQEKLGMIKQFTESLLIISKLTAFIGAIIAFATVYIMIFINVLQKRSQIGILKAIGITKEVILISYILQAFFYGAFGSMVGIAITSLVNFYFNSNPIKMPLGDVYPVITYHNLILSISILVVSSIVAGYLAARGVVKETILEAIYNG